MSRSEMNDRDAYLMEYTDDNTIDRYITNTAGKGIQYVLAHVYGPLYSEIIDSICIKAGSNKDFRVLEYGCGAGMNLIYIVRLLFSKGVPIVEAMCALVIADRLLVQRASGVFLKATDEHR